MSTDDREERLLKKLMKASTTEMPRKTMNCPDEMQLAAFVDNQLEPPSTRELEQHLETCEACLQQVVFLMKTSSLDEPVHPPDSLLGKARELEPASPKRFWTWVPALAASLLLIVSLSLWLPFWSEVPDPQFQTERGAPTDSQTLRILHPAAGDRIEGVPFQIEWSSLPTAFSYEARIATLSGDLVWESQSESTHLQIEESAGLENGRDYYLYVRAYLPQGRVLRSEMVRFRFGSSPD